MRWLYLVHANPHEMKRSNLSPAPAVVKECPSQEDATGGVAKRMNEERRDGLPNGAGQREK
jgi:hypothetical protein